MKHVIYLAFFISTAVFGQNQSVPKFSKQIDAMLDSMLTSFKSGNSKQAFIVLDSAIQLDSTNIGLYELKVSWEGYLKKYDQAVKTSLRLIRLVPNNPLTQFHTAIYYEKIGDSITAKPYYLKSIELFDKAIDTSSAENKKCYSSNRFFRAIATVLSGDEKLGNTLLYNMYNECGETYNSDFYKYFNKSRTELIKIWFEEK